MAIGPLTDSWLEGGLTLTSAPYVIRFLMLNCSFTRQVWHLFRPSDNKAATIGSHAVTISKTLLPYSERGQEQPTIRLETLFSFISKLNACATVQAENIALCLYQYYHRG